MRNLTIFILLIIFNISNLEYSYSSIDNKVLVKVGNQIISSYELKDKIKTKIFLSNQQLTQENINKYKNQVLESLIKLKLMKIELARYKIDVKHNEKNRKYLEQVALKYETNIDGLKIIFKSNNLDFENFKNEVDVHQAWKNLVYQKHKNKIFIDEKEIELELNNLLKKKKNLQEFKLAEIEVMVKNKSETDKVIIDLKKQIKDIGFQNTAIKYSSASTALNGGNLGWINRKILSSEMQKTLDVLNKGEISPAIVKGNSIVFFKVLDKRNVNIKDINAIELRKNITVAKQNELLNIFSNNYLSKLRSNTFIKIN